MAAYTFKPRSNALNPSRPETRGRYGFVSVRSTAAKSGSETTTCRSLSQPSRRMAKGPPSARMPITLVSKTTRIIRKIAR